MEQIIFYIFAIIIVVMAIASVASKKTLRAVVYLLMTLLATAALYFMLDYNFLGAVQMAVYAGGVIILFIFSVLLVHHVEGELEEPPTSRKLVMAALSLLGLGITLSIIYSHDFKVVEATKEFDVKDIGRGLLGTAEGGFILPFEVISVLLLAAIIGSIIIAKGQKERS
jgi:NADH-quinone oxidoreductase subunit J